MRERNMDACEIANFLATELFMQQLVSMDGIQSGVPTLTTSTLTPTTLRNIEQTFIELTTEPPVSCQAGFVPPLAPYNNFDSNDNNSLGSSEGGSQSPWHSPILDEENSMATTDTSSVATIINSNGSPSLPIASSTPCVATSTPSTRRNVGGRRPNKPTNLSPEEEEKRKIRRERNKLAAARCRKRRVDQTNELLVKVSELEKEKQGLQKTIEELQLLKADIQVCWEAHRSHCRLQTNGGRISPLDMKPIIITSDNFNTKIIKDEPLDPIDSLDGPPSPKRIMLSSNNPIIPPLPHVSTITSTLAQTTQLLNTPTLSTAPINITTRPNRPSSLNVPLTITPSQALGLGKNVSDIAGVPITTPSTGTFNFDSLMDGGTGLTPVAAPLLPTCSSQNKHPLELTTPTSEPSKLVSL